MTLLATQPQEPPRPHRFTRKEYYQMAEMGLFEGRRVELIEGEIIDMAAMKDLHAVAMGIVERSLGRAFPGCWARNQVPLSLGMDSDPEPDFAVVPGEPRDYKGKGHPRGALWVLELADTSLAYDRSTKAAIYAKSGIKDYWIVNLLQESVEVMREPVEHAGAMLGWRYQSVTVYRPGQTIAPLAKPESPIAVADLLP